MSRHHCANILLWPVGFDRIRQPSLYFPVDFLKSTSCQLAMKFNLIGFVVKSTVILLLIKQNIQQTP